MSGSGLFENQRGVSPSKTAPGKGGLPGEVGDLRRDVGAVLGTLAAITVQQWNAPLAGGADTLKFVTGVVTEPIVHGPEDFTPATLADMLEAPRRVVIGIGGPTATDAPDSATIKGKLVNGEDHEETVAVPQVDGGEVSTSHFFASIESIAFTAGQGTGAAYLLGTSLAIGLAGHLQSRAGAPAVTMEVEDGTVAGPDALAGTYTLPPSALPNGSYEPGAAADGVKDYAIYYEYDPAA